MTSFPPFVATRLSAVKLVLFSVLPYRRSSKAARAFSGTHGPRSAFGAQPGLKQTFFKTACLCVLRSVAIAFAPLRLCQHVYMPDPSFMHERHGRLRTGMMVLKSQFFLDPFGFAVSIIIAAPDRLHAQGLERIPHKRRGCLWHIAAPPERLSQPISKLISGCLS